MKDISSNVLPLRRFSNSRLMDFVKALLELAGAAD